MKTKTIFGIIVAIVFAFILAGCYQGEITVKTTINADGSGERIFILDIMDDLLYDQPIPNPDDPDGSKDFGPVLNDQHIKGGIIAIQTWLEEHKPKLLTLHEPEIINTYHRIFKLSFTFDSWDDYIEKYKTLVNLSPNVTWDDFEADELPQWKVEGDKRTYFESKELLMASMDWAITGIHTDIYDPKDLGDVAPSDYVVLANYYLYMGSTKLELTQKYDTEYVNPNTGNEGAVVYPSETEFTQSHTYTKAEEPEKPGESKGISKGALIGIIVGSVVVVGAVGVGAFFFFRKKA